MTSPFLSASILGVLALVSDGKSQKHPRCSPEPFADPIRDSAANEEEVQMAIVSTGFAPHTDGDGHSQATLMLVYAAEGDADEFDAFWLEMFGVPAGRLTEEPVHGLVARHNLDGATNLHTAVVAYLGLAGTYEHNRPHFVASLQSSQGD